MKNSVFCYENYAPYCCLLTVLQLTAFLWRTVCTACCLSGDDFTAGGRRGEQLFSSWASWKQSPHWRGGSPPLPPRGTLPWWGNYIHRLYSQCAGLYSSLTVDPDTPDIITVTHCEYNISFLFHKSQSIWRCAHVYEPHVQATTLSHFSIMKYNWTVYKKSNCWISVKHVVLFRRFFQTCPIIKSKLGQIVLFSRWKKITHSIGAISVCVFCLTTRV